MALDTLEHQHHVAQDQSAPAAQDDALLSARQHAQESNLPFSGRIAPDQAWRLVQQGKAVLIDVRTTEERKFVGYVPDSLHVAWATGTALTRNPRFVKELEAKIKDHNATLLFLCRSGHRSAAAAEAATRAGFNFVFNISEGFEGDLNSQQQRGLLGGWRHHALPWVQD